LTNYKKGMSRRTLLSGAAGGSVVAAGAQAAPVQAVNRNSAPSKLRITDMRACRIAGFLDFPIIRIDTNQGVHGYGEVRDATVEGVALVLKPHIVGRNPLDIEPLLDNLRKFSNHRRGGGGYSAVDTALHDIAGKVYGVPCWRLLGSKYRTRVRMYCHFPLTKDPQAFAEGVRKRKQQGFTFYKMDDVSGQRWAAGKPGAVQDNGVVTDKGLQMLCDHIAAAREIIGYEAPLAIDHFGPLDVNDSIRYARAFEPYRLAWAEDMLQVGTQRSGDAPAT